MQMGYDFEDGRQTAGTPQRIGGFAEPWRTGGDPAPDGLAQFHPDWAGLKARFHAVHALRRTLAASVGAALPAGGFHAAGEAVLASCRASGAGVNHIYSANGKGLSGNNGAVAVLPTRGDRGML